MSVVSIAAPLQYLGNGITVSFPFPYKFFANTDLVVLTTVLSTLVDSNKTLNVDYTVTGAGLDAGGAVVFTTAPVAGLMVTIFRDTARQQPVDYVSQDNFPAESHEAALDRVTQQSQDMAVIVARTLRVPRTRSTLPQMDRPTWDGKLVGFDTDGNLDSSVSLDGIRTIILANPVDALTSVTDYGSIGDEVVDLVDYGLIT
jgi:hypothetical protein